MRHNYLKATIFAISVVVFIVSSLFLISNFIDNAIKNYNSTGELFDAVILIIYGSLFILEFILGGLMGIVNEHGLTKVLNIITLIMLFAILAIMIMSGLFIYKALATSGIILSGIWGLSIVAIIASVFVNIH